MSIEEDEDAGHAMHNLAARLFPICRSITGNGVRESLAIIRELVPELALHEVPSGTACFDWQVPDEWNIRDAYLIGPDGKRIVDFKDHNLHVVNYSVPVDVELSLADLQPHLHSLPDLPDAIPYVTSYYKTNWGFCLSENQRASLKPGIYRAVIDSDLKPGSLTYAELVIPGDLKDEIFVSTYICHPSMGNNELSGPAVWTYLARWAASTPRRYTYRFVITPETIGSICYISRNLEYLRQRTIAAFNLTCIGDDRDYSFLPSRKGNTIADRVALHVLKHWAPSFKHYSYLDRGSDERQYCSPGVDLPMVSVMRSKYREYPEYHTSLDDLSLITPSGLNGGLEALKHCLMALENDKKFIATNKCEPQLGKRGLYRSVGGRSVGEAVSLLLDTLSYCDGEHSVIDIAELLSKSVWELQAIFDDLLSHNLISELV